jgi:tetratricopeptide (TPR) repeat protein
MGLQDYRGAIQVLVGLDRNISGVRFNLGLCHYLQEDFLRALPLFQSCYESGDRTAALLRVLLLTHHHLGEVDAAIALVRENEAIAGSVPDLAGHVAILFVDEGQLEQGENWAQRALALDADCTDALVAHALVCAENEDTEGARKSYESALARSPENGRAWVGLGTLTMLTGDFESAAQQLERGLRAMPRHVDSWMLLGWNHVLTKRLEDAERAFKHAIDLDRNCADAYGGLANVAALRGDRIAAGQLIDIAQQLDPKSGPSKLAGAVLAGQQGDAEAFRTSIGNCIESITGLNLNPNLVDKA